MENLKVYWDSVEEFYKKITPKNEKLSEIENKIKVPLHYIVMVVSVLLVALVYLLMRKFFFAYLAFFVALGLTMKDLSEEKAKEKKWAAYWLVFSVFQMLPSFLDRSMYYSIIKCVILIYFAAFDECTIVVEALTKANEYIKKGWEWYLDFCKGNVKMD